MLAFLVIGAAALLVSGVLRLHSEEDAGRVEGLLVTGSSRPGLLLGWLAVVTVLALGVLLMTGLGLGAGMTITTGQGGWLSEMTLAALTYAPATLLLGSVAVALLGLRPRWGALAWLPLVWSAIVVFLGELLDLPGWANGLSPLHHTPLAPEAEIAATPLLVMSGCALALTLAGVLGLRQRDVGAA